MAIAAEDSDFELTNRGEVVVFWFLEVNELDGGASFAGLAVFTDAGILKQ